MSFSQRNHKQKGAAPVLCFSPHSGKRIYTESNWRWMRSGRGAAIRTRAAYVVATS